MYKDREINSEWAEIIQTLYVKFNFIIHGENTFIHQLYISNVCENKLHWKNVLTVAGYCTN